MRLVSGQPKLYMTTAAILLGFFVLGRINIGRINISISQVSAAGNQTNSLIHTSDTRTNNIYTNNDNEPCRIAVLEKNNKVFGYRCSSRLSESAARSYLANQSDTKIVTPLRQYQLALEPNDIDYKFQKSYLEKIRAPQAWDTSQSTTVRSVIAILDSGVDITNPDLAPNIWFNSWEVPQDGQDNDRNGFIDDINGWDFIANNADPLPKFDEGWSEVAIQHGTIVAGVAAAAGNNVQGVAGVTWHARIMPIRVLDGRGIGDTVTVARGIQYAIDNRADIINLSFVGLLSDPILQDAIQRAYRAGILVVAAAGNEQQAGVDMNKQPHYPVCDDGRDGENQVIGVAAVDNQDVRAEFSNFGAKCIDISAPGVKIYSTQFVSATHPLFQSYYGGYWSGTSVAAPLVSGALALLKSAHPKLSPSQLRDILMASGDLIDNVNPGEAGKLGRRLNLQSAFALASSNIFAQKSPIVIGPQSGAAAEISLYDISSELMQKFLAYQARYDKGVNLASADVDGDGQADIIAAPRAGGGPHVKILNTKGNLEFQFMALPEVYRGGLSVAAADFTGDNKADIVIGLGKGGTNMVRIYDGQGALRYQFIPYDPNYIGGINVAVGDVDNDGQPEIITAPSGSARLPVRIFDKFGRKKGEFFAFPWVFTGGLSVVAGDVDGNGRADIIAAPGAGGGPQIRVFNLSGRVLRQFFAYDKQFRGGVNLAVGDVNGDGVNEIITTPGAGGGPQIRVFNSKNQAMSSFFIEPRKFRGGLSVTVLR